MEPTPPKRRGRPRKTSNLPPKETETKTEFVEPKIENLLTSSPIIVEQRRAAKKETEI